MNEIIYLPKKPNSRFTYLKYSSIILLILFIFHYLHIILRFNRTHSHILGTWFPEIILGTIFLLYLFSSRLTTEVRFNFDTKRMEISYVSLLKSFNKINIDFENINFKLKKNQRGSNQIWTLYIYEKGNRKYKITPLIDNYTKEDLEKISKQDFEYNKDNR